MTTRIEISPGEHGQIRVFALDLPEPAADIFCDDPTALAQALGLTSIDVAATAFPITALAGVGLPGYLTEGHNVSPQSLAADKAMLSTLAGHVAVVPSHALPDGTTALTITQPLRLIGTYAEDRAPTKFTPLPADSAKGVLAGNAGPATKPKGNGAILLALLAIPLCLAVLLFWVKT